MGKKTTLIILLIFFTVSFAIAQNSIDISGLSQEKYNPGEQLTFKIILLEDETQITERIDYKITDALKKKEIVGTTLSNQETSIEIENNFPSGIWKITANYTNSQIERTFLIGENPGIKFLIENDELIIRNIGNVQYTKPIQIKIGSETNTYTQNIQAGDEKILKLISTDGKYDIEVTDGTTTIKKENVQLFGTGNVIGAVDKELVGYTGLVGADDLRAAKNRTISLDKLPLSMIFIAAVGVLMALVIVERKLSKKNKK